jgi:hypothetical protein
MQAAVELPNQVIEQLEKLASEEGATASDLFGGLSSITSGA